MSLTVETKGRAYQRFARRVCTATLCATTLIFAGRQAVVAHEPPIASFGVQADEKEPAAPNVDNGDAPEPVLSFSFRFAPWESVLIKFAEVADLTLDLTEVPPGTFNYRDNGRYSPREALDVLNGYLLQGGFVLVRRDRFLVCVNLAKGVPANLIPTVTAEQLEDYGDNELISVILSHAKMDAGLAASQIEQLQGPQGKVTSLNGTNSLLVTDTGGNLRLINRLMTQGAFSRRAPSSSETGFQSFALQYVRADETERLIRKMFGLPPAEQAVQDRAAATTTPRSATLNITADARTNQLFVTGPSTMLTSIGQIIEAYDIAGDTSDRATQQGSIVTRIVPLPNADVIVIGKTLDSLSPRIRVSTTRSVRQASISQGKPADEPAAGDRSRLETPASPLPQSPDGRDR